MKYGLTSILSTAAVCALLCAAPTSAYALVRHPHAKAEQAQRHSEPYPSQPGYYAYPSGYSAYIPGYAGNPMGGLSHPTGCANCPPQ